MGRPSKTDKPAREKIIETAYRLFYEQGYFQTGVNQVIAEAKVSKATFFAHFPTKDDLCLAYLRERARVDLSAVKDFIQSQKTPRKRFFAFMEALETWLPETKFRGCGFANLTVEVLDPASPLRKEVIYHDDAFRSILRDVSRDLVASDKAKYGHLDVEELTDFYYLVVEGAIASARNYNDVWPIRKARKALERYVGSQG
jgi:AcrR family transcriptional regulator